MRRATQLLCVFNLLAFICSSLYASDRPCTPTPGESADCAPYCIQIIIPREVVRESKRPTYQQFSQQVNVTRVECHVECVPCGCCTPCCMNQPCQKYVKKTVCKEVPYPVTVEGVVHCECTPFNYVAQTWEVKTFQVQCPTTIGGGVTLTPINCLKDCEPKGKSSSKNCTNAAGTELRPAERSQVASVEQSSGDFETALSDRVTALEQNQIKVLAALARIEAATTRNSHLTGSEPAQVTE